MAFVIPVAEGDLFEIRLRGQLHGQTTITAFRYALVNEGAETEADLEPFAVAFNDAVLDPIATVCSPEMTYVHIAVQKIAPVRYIPYIHIPATAAGVSGTTSLPSGSALVMRRKLLVAGPQAQGRIYIPGLDQTREDESLIDDATWTGLELPAIASGMLENLTFGLLSLVPCLIVPAPGGAWENRGTLFDVVPDRVIRYQRRREVGVGQ